VAAELRSYGNGGRVTPRHPGTFAHGILEPRGYSLSCRTQLTHPTERYGIIVTTSTEEQVKAWCATAAQAAAAKGGEDTIILAVGRMLAITDAFVLTSGSNVRQVRTIAEEVEKQVKEAGGPAPLRIEGLDDARWVLMDFGDFVVHVLVDEARDFYEIERLWSDAEKWAWEEAPAAEPAR
jgi:ribosome-associated protein